jgi:hypothetical protein
MSSPPPASSIVFSAPGGFACRRARHLLASQSQFSPDTCHISSSPGLSLDWSFQATRKTNTAQTSSSTSCCFLPQEASPTFIRPSLDRPAPHSRLALARLLHQDSQFGTGHCQSVQFRNLHSTHRWFWFPPNSRALVAPSCRAFASLRSIYQLHSRLFNDSGPFSSQYASIPLPSLTWPAFPHVNQLEYVRPNSVIFNRLKTIALSCKGPLHRRLPTSDFPEYRRGPPLASQTPFAQDKKTLRTHLITPSKTS